MNKLITMFIMTVLLVLGGCSRFQQPLPPSGVTSKEVANESYTNFISSVKELKTAFFPAKKIVK